MNKTDIEEFFTDDGYPVNIRVTWERIASPFTSEEIQAGHPKTVIRIRSCLAIISGDRIASEILPYLSSGEKEKIVELLTYRGFA